MRKGLFTGAVISGIGQSDVGRRLHRPALDLTLDAAVAALDDAGLSRADIDGLSAYPGGESLARSFAGPSLLEVQDALRLELSWYSSGVEVAAQMGAVIAAAMAVEVGLANHVLVYRTVTEGTARARAKNEVPPPGPPVAANGSMQWLAPYGVTGPPHWYAPYLRRYMHDFGLTREQLAQIPIAARVKSAANPRAVYREPLTLEQYLSSRTISDPICLYDCDVPCDGATAFVLSRADYARDVPHRAVRIESVGAGSGPRMYRDQFPDHCFGAVAASQMWSRTNLRPSDVDVAQLYDGFSFLTLWWLEALGFCGRGESGPFVEDGRRVALGGELPLNTSGGQLAAGRLHGFGLLYEACEQLRGQSGARQVPDAEVVVVATGGQPNVGCLLLTDGSR